MQQFLHLHAVFRNFSGGIEGKAGTILVDGNDTQINFRTEPAIQLDLTLAKMATFFQGAEINKPEIHRLLHLEDKR